MFNCLSAEVKAISAKFEGFKYVNAYTAPMSSIPSFYSIKPSASVEFPIMQLMKMILSSFMVLNLGNPLNRDTIKTNMCSW